MKNILSYAFSFSGMMRADAQDDLIKKVKENDQESEESEEPPIAARPYEPEEE